MLGFPLHIFLHVETLIGSVTKLFTSKTFAKTAFLELHYSGDVYPSIKSDITPYVQILFGHMEEVGIGR